MTSRINIEMTPSDLEAESVSIWTPCKYTNVHVLMHCTKGLTFKRAVNFEKGEGLTFEILKTAMGGEPLDQESIHFHWNTQCHIPFLGLPLLSPMSSGSLRRMVSFMISSKIDFGSSTGTSRVLPRCWLYCNAQASLWPLMTGPHHFLIESWLSLNHTPSSLWI